MAMNPFAMYESSGQDFTQRGRATRAGSTYARDVVADFDGAIEDMAAISQRMAVMGYDAAVEVADALTWRTKEVIRRMMPPVRGWAPRQASTGEPFEFSKGRLAAAWGQYTPEDMRGQVDENDSVPIQAKHEAWARENGVAGSGRSGEGRDTGEETQVQMGALTRIYRIRSSAWSVEVGTFLPYAPLANDGGTMMIHPYGNPRATVMAQWEGVHYMELGAAQTEEEVEGIIEGSVNAAIGQPTGRRPRRRG